MSEISGKEDQFRLRIESVHDLDRALEGLRAGRIGRSLETDVRVAELHEIERRDVLAVLPAKPSAHRRRRPAAGHRRSDRDQRADAERHAGYLEETAPVERFFHLHLQMRSGAELASLDFHPAAAGM